MAALGLIVSRMANKFKSCHARLVQMSLMEGAMGLRWQEPDWRMVVALSLNYEFRDVLIIPAQSW
jgi:hypothetical protein